VRRGAAEMGREEHCKSVRRAPYCFFMAPPPQKKKGGAFFSCSFLFEIALFLLCSPHQKRGRARVARVSPQTLISKILYPRADGRRTPRDAGAWAVLRLQCRARRHCLRALRGGRHNAQAAAAAPVPAPAAELQLSPRLPRHDPRALRPQVPGFILNLRP
jgi:hypothetical protein